MGLFSADGKTLIATTNPNLPDSTVLSTGAQSVTLTNGTTTTVNAGVYAPKAVSITGTVFTDINGDGLIDGQDKGVSGVTVQLLNASSAVVATTTTAADGTYAFNHVAAGTYSQHVVAPNGYSYSTPGGNTAPAPFVPGPPVTAGSNLLTNGSFEQTTASTSNGLTGGYYGWTQSTGTASTPFGSGPGLGPEIQVTNGTSTGRYGVNATPDTQNAAYSGTNAAYFVDDDAVETISQNVTLVAGQTYEVGFDLDEPSVGAGNPGFFSLTASLGGKTITTTDSRSGTQLALDKWTHFADLFTAKTSGTYALTFKYQSGVLGTTLVSKDVLIDDVYVHAGQVTQNLTATSQVGANGITAPVTLNGGQTVGNESAGLAPPPASVQGVVFNDVNDNGVLDGTEKGMSGDTVVLYSGSNVVGAASTDANGNYSIARLLAGSSYTVQVSQPNGTVFSPVGTASGATDSTVNSSGAESITVGANGGVSVVNAGTYTTPGITGLPSSESAGNAAINPFGAVRVTVTVPDPNGVTSVTITLSNAGSATDADGMLSGSGLVKTGAGTCSLSAATPAALSSELQATDLHPQRAAGPRPPPQRHRHGPGRETEQRHSQRHHHPDRKRHLLPRRHPHSHRTRRDRRVATRRRDDVATLVDGTILHLPIKWVRCRHLDAAGVQRTGIRPVRIRAGAFADGVPHRDLLVTPEHCILVECRLIPARMLVNDRSIIEDRSIASFSFYHVELETHGVLLAEGLPTESYLDAGNRGSFANAEVPALLPYLSIDASHKSWATHAAAPLATDRETVEPIWRRLQARAAGLGITDPRPGTTLSDDPQLRILLDNGDTVGARWNGHGRHFFQIPSGARPVPLLSRMSVPADVIGPFVDDRRSLGVQVRNVVFWSGLQDAALAAADIGFDGWHAAEDQCRWTDGAAALDLPRAHTADTFL